MELTSGSSLSRYTIGDKMGAGGMGVVYRAFDTRLERSVALKVLPPAAIGDAARRERFVREAKAASALNHPHIVTVFDIDRVATADGEIDLLAMELVDGEPLDVRLERGPLPVARALDLAVEMADALGAAHRAGIVHRDVKPGNLMVTSSGQLKLLDFGLARNLPGVNVDPTAATVPDGLTMTGAVVGTPAYMAPEQATGKPADARSDVFAAGAVLYEMLAGRRPFVGETPMAQLLAVVHGVAPPLRGVRAEVPLELERIVARCLVKDPAARYPSAVELHAELVALRTELSAPRRSALAELRRPAFAAPLALALVAAIAGVAWWANRTRERSRARAELARLEALVERQELIPAFLLARELAPRLPGDRALEQLLLAATDALSLRSSPPGAEVEFRGYLDDPERWYGLGTTPLEAIRLPSTPLLFRVRKDGFETFVGQPFAGVLADSFLLDFELQPAGSVPEGMVRIPAGTGGFEQAELALPAFWLGRHEVTHREFQRFVDAGGYEDPELWREPFASDGRTLSFAEARALFLDATGRPGPSTWRFGAFPEGEAEHPVGGVSWHEASAYARWAGAELPTLHHWFRAAGIDAFSEILQASNFGGRGAVAVGSTHALSPYGNVDMAGNLFEWTATSDGRGRRYAAGGAWNEPNYTFAQPGALSPFDRGTTRGLRLARYEEAPPAAAREPVEAFRLELDLREPVDDTVFAAFLGFYDYDRTNDLRASIDAVDDSSPHYRWERVSYAAAYGGERVPAHLLLPKSARPPFQVVVYFPSSPAEQFASSQTLDGLPWFEFLVRSGRAVLFPIYKNTYERRIPGWRWSPTARRDVLLQWSKDLGRSLDYLATRSDVDSERVAFYGFSLGAVYGPVFVAVEPRLRAALLLGGGIHPSPYLPEVDPLNFAPRVRVPTLMLTGRDDFVRPVATHQEPLLRLLGTPDEQKRIAQFDGGHTPSDINAIVREANAWLDRWLGPVTPNEK